MDGPLGETLPSKLVESYRYERQTDEIFMEDIVKECYKNLNKWDVILEKSRTDL
jgi:hypothetical protein